MGACWVFSGVQKLLYGVLLHVISDRNSDEADSIKWLGWHSKGVADSSHEAERHGRRTDTQEQLEH